MSNETDATAFVSKTGCNSMTFHSTTASYAYPRETKWMPEFYDVIIGCGENGIAAHRVILAAHSDFFKQRLKNERLAKMNYHSDNIFNLTIDGLKWHCIEAVVEFMYTAHITVTSENVYDLVESSDYFCMPEIKKFCLDFLETYLCSDNCLSIMEFASSRDIEFLREKAEDCLLKNFQYVMHCDEFKNLKLLELSNVFQTAKNSSVKICESLHFKAIVEWVKYDNEREVYFDDLFDLVKLERLKPDYLSNSIGQEKLVRLSLHSMQRLFAAFEVATNKKSNLDAIGDPGFYQKLVDQRELFSLCFNDRVVDMWYVISSEWMKKWVKYVTNDGYDWQSEMGYLDSPGPIDNSCLFTSSNFKILKRTLRPSIDYKFVPETAWQLLCSWYGEVEGQPPIGEKGPLLDQVNRASSYHSEDDDFVIDPIRLCLKYSETKKTFTRIFSRWNKLIDVDDQMRLLYRISPFKRTFLWNETTALEKNEYIADCELLGNKILLTPHGFHSIANLDQADKLDNSENDSAENTERVSADETEDDSGENRDASADETEDDYWENTDDSADETEGDSGENTDDSAVNREKDSQDDLKLSFEELRFSHSKKIQNSRDFSTKSIFLAPW